MMQQMFLGYGGGSTPESFEYFYDGSTSTTITVPGAVSFFKVAGVAAGSPGPNSTGSNTGGHAGGGGGAGNLAGYTVPNATVAGQTIYIGTSPNGPSYIKTGSHSGTAIWEAGASSGQPGGSMVAGPGNQGGSGGSVAPRYNTGNPGFGAPNAGSGGGSDETAKNESTQALFCALRWSRTQDLSKDNWSMSDLETVLPNCDINPTTLWNNDLEQAE